MATGATGQLGLALPVQGELSGTWGDTVNNGITQYTNIAIAGTLTLTNDGAVTLANTTGDASASNITSTLTGAGTVTAQFAIVRVTGTLTTAKVVTGPSYSKTYTVVNAATGGIVTFKASGQTGVSIAVGESAFVYFNGTDYVKVVGTATAGAAGGSNTQVQYNNAGVLAGITGATTNGTALTLVAPILGTPASATLTNATGLPISTGVSGLGTGIATALAVNTGSAGAPVLFNGALGTPSSGTVTNLTGTASININGTVGATTATTGAFTTLTTSSTVTHNGGTANGVTYLNGSKVLTSGSALVFDGTNLGVGVTPSAWNVFPAFQTTGSYALSALGYSSNMFYQSAYKYMTTDLASRYEQASGQHRWFNAPSGTAGNAITFTQAMTLDASGNLGLGTTGGTDRLYVERNYNGSTWVRVNNTDTGGGAAAGVIFKNDIGDHGAISSLSAANSPAGSLFMRTLGAYPVTFGTNNTERARIDSSGNLLVGGTAARGTTAGTAHLDLFNGTAPAGTLTNGVSLYSSSGDLKFMNAAGDAFDVGYRNIPQNSQSAAYTLVLADAGKHIFHPVGDNNARTFTIPANSSVAYPIGTAITFINMAVANVTIAITTDTLTLSPAGTTGSRTLATNGSATCIKITSTEWLISGSGLT